MALLGLEERRFTRSLPSSWAKALVLQVVRADQCICLATITTVEMVLLAPRYVVLMNLASVDTHLGLGACRNWLGFCTQVSG